MAEGCECEHQDFSLTLKLKKDLRSGCRDIQVRVTFKTGWWKFFILAGKGDCLEIYHFINLSC